MNYVEDKRSDERLGEYIARIRSERGMTVEEVSAVTKVTVSYLKSIEAGEWKVFPVEAYVRGYLNSISAKLNLDPKKVLAWYAAETGKVVDDSFEDVSKPGKIAPMKEGEIKKRSKAVPIVIILIGLGFLVASHYLDVKSFDFIKTEPAAEKPVAVEDTTSNDPVEMPEGAVQDSSVETVDSSSVKKDSSVSNVSVSQAVVDEAVKNSALPASATIFISSDSKKEVAAPTNKTTIELVGSGTTTSWVGIKRRENSDRFAKEFNISKSGAKSTYSSEDTLYVTIGEPKAISKMLLNGVETPFPEARFGRVIKFRVFGGQILK